MRARLFFAEFKQRASEAWMQAFPGKKRRARARARLRGGWWWVDLYSERVGFEPTWERTPHLISSQRRYDRFGTSPRGWDYTGSCISF